MSEQTQSFLLEAESAASIAPHLLFEAAQSDRSLAEFLNRAHIEPINSLNEQVRERLGRGFEVTHSPIIITDGSVRVNLSSEEYTLAGSVYTSHGLTLQRVESTVRSHSNGSNICYLVRDPDEVCTVIFHCLPENGGVGENNITVQGGLSMSPIISIDPVEFDEVINPPPARKVHISGTRRVMAVEILSTLHGVTRREHLCPLAGDGCEYSILDDHQPV